MSMEEHFQTFDVQIFEINGEKFGYKPATAKDELSWVSECIITKEDGTRVQDQALVSKCKFKNLIEAPYPKELVKKMIGVEKTWAELSHDERWNLIGKMKPSFFDKLSLKMREIDSGTPEEKEEKKS